MTAPNKDEGLIARLDRIAASNADANRRVGRTGKLWAIETEVKWQAARAIQDLEADLSEALKHLKAMSHVVPRPFEVEAAHAFLERLSSTADGEGALRPSASVPAGAVIQGEGNRQERRG